MNQPTLINLRPLATTRQMRARIRARNAAAGAGSLSKSPPTLAERLAAPIAEPQVISRTKSRVGLQESEFNLPDEDRRFPVSIDRCPIHWRRPELARVADRSGTIKYGVVCPKCDPNMLNVTWQSSSRDAVAVWKMAATLSKL